MKRSLAILLFLLSFYTGTLFSQELDVQQSDSIFRDRGEVYFKFNVLDKEQVNQLSRMISIDKITGDEVYAYANRKEFDKFIALGYPFTILTPPSKTLDQKYLRMGKAETDQEGLTIWNFYPTYQQYLDFMAGFATAYPTICRVDTIGTSVQGRLLIAVKISDSVQYNRGKPHFLYTSSIHGDETTGYVLMLHLIDYLLTHYGTDPRITDLINNTQLYINPLANPDGTYHGGNNTVYGATRTNANNVDLNRNYPDPAEGPHPDGNPWQVETVAFMSFADSNHFVLSMNFHGGSEVFNYPWDTWQKLHPDDNWFYYLGREYADTVHKYGPAGYFTDLDNGVTNGYAWYRITGGRQDYMTYFQHGREVTLEISTVKTPPANQLLNFWNYNFHSFLNYIEQVNYGINGQVTDSVTGQPLNAKVNIFNHDFDNSFVNSNLPSGWYFRPIYQGSYNLTFSCPGYYTRTIKNVNVSNRSTTLLNVKMVSLSIGGVNEILHNKLTIIPNPARHLVKVVLPETGINHVIIDLIDVAGKKVISGMEEHLPGEWFMINLDGIEAGIYLIIVRSDSRIYKSKLVVE